MFNLKKKEQNLEDILCWYGIGSGLFGIVYGLAFLAIMASLHGLFSQYITWGYFVRIMAAGLRGLAVAQLLCARWPELIICGIIMVIFLVLEIIYYDPDDQKKKLKEFSQLIKKEEDD